VHERRDRVESEREGGHQEEHKGARGERRMTADMGRVHLVRECAADARSESASGRSERGTRGRWHGVDQRPSGVGLFLRRGPGTAVPADDRCSGLRAREHVKSDQICAPAL